MNPATGEMPQEDNEVLANKISDLTESLHRTTDVLSSADRMIDHYKDLNCEHEHEIARVSFTFNVVWKYNLMIIAL